MYKIKAVTDVIRRGRITFIVIIGLIWLCTSSFISRGSDVNSIERRGGRWTKRQDLLDICGQFSETVHETPLGCILESGHTKKRLPSAVDDPHIYNFLNEDFYPAHCDVEWDMNLLVKEVISPTDNVMEFGGRYGTTTCGLAVQQNNSGALISVEPDPTASKKSL